MPLVVEMDEPDDPLNVGLLGASGIMPHAQHLVDLVEQAWRPGPGQFAQLQVEDLAVEKIHRIPAGGDGQQRVLFGLRNELEELGYFRQPHLAGMAFAAEQDETPAPVHEGGHGRFGVTALLRGLAQLVQ
jgi:hypothetical protein